MCVPKTPLINLRRTKEKKSKSAKIKPVLPGGFRDYGPADAIARQRMLEKIRKTFEDFGFDPMETPAVERTEVLLGGEAESEKLVYRVVPAKRDIKQDDMEKYKSSLRFDLTVPLARFIAANPEIPKPFKRYQIGQVWRGESPQAGRYREFMQSDIDIAGSSSLNADAEIIQVMYETIRTLGIEDFRIRLNSREETVKALEKLNAADIEGTMRMIDKKDKLPFAKWENGVLKVSGLSESDLKNYLSAPEPASIRALRERAEELGVPKNYLLFDSSLVRGLEYYTGSIFELVLDELPEIGSVFGGGRYDNLVTQFTGEKIPAVGASLGIDRLFAALKKLGKIKAKKTVTKALILNVSPSLENDYFAIVKKLREANINTALYLGDDKAFRAQLAYAVKKEIPYVIIYGEDEAKRGVVSVKNLTRREQEEIRTEKLAEYFKK